MRPPRLQSVNTELAACFYRTAPAYADITKSLYHSPLSDLLYRVRRYMPGDYLDVSPEDPYSLPHRHRYIDEFHNYDYYSGPPLVVMLVTKDDVEQGWMCPEEITDRPFYITEYVLKQYGHYFAYRRRNHETACYEDLSYFPYLQEYLRYEPKLRHYADATTYRYLVVTKDDPEAGWAKPAVIKNKKET